MRLNALYEVYEYDTAALYGEDGSSSKPVPYGPKWPPKPSVIWSLGPKALKCESLEP